jgi:polyhydroxyalkanoate synthesis regulator phasin
VSFLNHKVLLAAGIGTLTAVLLGGAALATFAPMTYDSPSQIGGDSETATENSGTDKLKSILDGLVGKGVITQAQADAILAALKTAAPAHDGATVRGIFANLFNESAKYLSLTPADLKTKLPGTSLGALADKTTGKSQSGLVTTLQTVVNAAIDKALADTKLTSDQATKAKADAPANIKKFVEHTYSQPRAPKTTTRETRVTEFIGDIYGAARDYLGLSQADLLKALREGKTLGEIAPTIAGKNKGDLVAKITATANAKIDKAVTDGKLTAEQATALKAQVGPAVAALVDRKLPTAIGKLPTLDRKP